MLWELKAYLLSEYADFDLEDIFDDTKHQYGFTRAVKYLNDLDAVFGSLVINPEIGRKRSELKDGLYSITEQEHIVFYRVQEDYIRIMRVLHGSKDMPKHF